MYVSTISATEPEEVCGDFEGSELCAQVEKFELTDGGYKACVVRTNMASAAEQLEECFEAEVRSSGKEKEMTFTWQ